LKPEVNKADHSGIIKPEGWRLFRGLNKKVVTCRRPGYQSIGLSSRTKGGLDGPHIKS
jgi:hypothetical protein